MSELFWPGDDRAGHHFSDTAFVAAMVEVERAWLSVLGHPTALLSQSDLTDVESGGNPVISLVAALRAQLSGVDDDAARWLHRGLTSQDVVDSALMMLLRDAAVDLRADLRRTILRLTELADQHRDTPMVARTLTQRAVPTTFGAKAAAWLTGVLDAYDDVVGLSFPVQLGGAGGTNAAVVELGLDPAAARTSLATGLGLDEALPWHTARRPVTRTADALVACTDAWSRIANDVLTLSRPEIGELSEGVGGGSSTMPHKANPVLSTLVRRAGLAAPQLAATLHAAAADQSDERASGGWHVEWDTLRVLVRRTLVAGSQMRDLLDGLRVHHDKMVTTLDAARDDVRAEQRSIAEVSGHHAPADGDYTGEARSLVDEVVARARTALKEDA
ncbi:lyase family protein [Nocardioides sp. InS609-2]|uniref:lyase family protein n=1 Tax=Nocardioides sp. InS609-2 TaxID=2760705 RepID=UPI0020C1775A|nr:lyase family protein [Nocardioides sp. InS609-2]